MTPARRLAAWVLPRSALVGDVLIIAGQRDAWRLRAERAERIADEAVAVAARYHDLLAEEQARNDSLAADWDDLLGLRVPPNQPQNNTTPGPESEGGSRPAARAKKEG